MLNPKEFAVKTGLSYNQVLTMCKSKELEAIKTRGGHYKIPEIAAAKYTSNTELYTKEEYQKVVKENERLKALIINIQNKIKEAC